MRLWTSSARLGLRLNEHEKIRPGFDRQPGALKVGGGDLASTL